MVSFAVSTFAIVALKSRLVNLKIYEFTSGNTLPGGMKTHSQL